MASPDLQAIHHGNKPRLRSDGRSFPGVVRRYFQEVVLPYDGDDCLIWPYSKISGYGQMSYNKRPSLVSRVVCEEIYGPPPNPDDHAAHLCGNGDKGCVAKRHLQWKDASENEKDKLLHGTSPRGSQCGTAKLNETQVREILSLKGKMLQREIAEKFGITRRYVGALHERRTWWWLSV